MHYDNQSKYSYTPAKSYSPKKYASNDGWHTGDTIQCADKCSHSEEKIDQPTIYIPWEIIEVISHLCREVTSEWQMLLKGTANSTFVNINGYYVPKQRVTGASVMNIDNISKSFIEENNIVATIHSHSNMNVFFSNTDDEMTNKGAIKFHIVVNNKLEFIAKGRYELPCGMSTFKDAEIILEKAPVTSVVIEGLENIEKEAPPVETWNAGYKPYVPKDDKAPINDPEPYDYEAQQYNLDNHLGFDGKSKSLILRKDKEIITDSHGLQEGGYMYDALTDTYMLDDGTVVEGLQQDWDAKGERYIYGIPPTNTP